jgi:PEGA domain
LAKIHRAASDITADQVGIHRFEVCRRKDPARQNVSGDVKLDPAKFQPAPLVPAAPPVPATQQVPPASPSASPNAGPSDTTPVSPDQGAAAELEVSSTPDGADIEIDGNFVGSKPSTLGVAAGPHQISVKKAGFKPWERTITVSSGHIKIDATLESQSN